MRVIWKREPKAGIAGNHIDRRLVARPMRSNRRQKMPQKEKPTLIARNDIFLIIAVLSAMFLVNTSIDSRIEDAVNDEQFIRRVSSHVRPYVIFDVNSSILVDGGAMQSLERIEVEHGTGDVDTPQGKVATPTLRIVVTPTHHLAYAPLIEKLGTGRLIHTPNPKRGPGHQWIYDELKVLHWGDANVPLRFRLEILK